jgi:hypothetical protein
MVILEGTVYQTRLDEIERTLISYDKEDKTQTIVVLWDGNFYESQDSEEKGSLGYLSIKGAKVGFELGHEGDGQCIKAWPLP